MLLYLNALTWTSGEESARLADEVVRARDLGAHVLLAHEMVGIGQEERHGCEFSVFFACADGTTPQELLHSGLYAEVATPLKGGPWRQASMKLIGLALGMGRLSDDDDEHDWLLGDDTFIPWKHGQALLRALERSSPSVVGSKSVPILKYFRRSAQRKKPKWNGAGRATESESHSALRASRAPDGPRRLTRALDGPRRWSSNALDGPRRRSAVERQSSELNVSARRGQLWRPQQKVQTIEVRSPASANQTSCSADAEADSSTRV
jgi:hypothetical protein